MNLQIFQDKLYIDTLNNFGLNIELNPTFSFKSMGIDPNNLINSDVSNLYRFLNNLSFIYYFEQIYIAHTIINNLEYIIKIDDEMTISIIGNNEYNWLNLILDDVDCLYFESFCLNNYVVTSAEPDYEKFGEIERKFLTF